ncbi:MAG: MMPL family transporter [Acidimicrobiia bacterium]
MAIGSRYARAVVRLRWLIVAGWAIVLVVLSLALPTLDASGGTGGFRGFAEPDNPAIQAEIRSFEKFGFPVLSRTAVVQRNPDGLSPAAQLRVITGAIEFNLDRPPELRRIEFALPLLNDSRVLPTREDGTTAITYLFYRPDVSFGRQTGLAAQYARQYVSGVGDQVVSVTGVIPARVAQLVILRNTLKTVEIVTVVVIFLIVGLTFRAVVAPLVTMATAGLSLGIILRLAGWIGNELGFDVPKEIEPVMVALLLGIVTDYSIFYLWGVKDRLTAGESRFDAARRSTAEFTPIVLVAGLTVAAGSLALLTARVGLFRTFGPGMATTILVSLAVAITFVPACLAILGKAVFWPRQVHRATPPAAPKPRRTRFLDTITRRRGAAAVVVVGVAAIAVAAAPARDLDLGFGVVNSLPESYEARRGAQHAAEGFLPGILSPTVLLLEGPDLADRRPQLARLQELLDERPALAVVAGPATLPSPVTVGAVLSTSGDAARYVLVYNSDPLGAQAISDLDELREQMPSMLAAAGLADAVASFAGDTALAEVTVSQTEADLGRVVLVATGFGLVLLVLFLRAVVAPVLLMVANVSAVAATLGLATVVFQTTADHSGLTFYVPFAAAVLLIALGADYSIFGVGYIWAEARDRPLIDAIRVAVPRSTRAISAAGVTLAVSFAILAVVPLRPFREFAFIMAVGIMIDVFVVRSLLVPSMISLLGTASGWPGGALRRPRVPLPSTVGSAKQEPSLAGQHPSPAGTGATTPVETPPETVAARPGRSRTGAGATWIAAGAVLAYRMLRKRRSRRR